jgi:hypothetical protein
LPRGGGTEYASGMRTPIAVALLLAAVASSVAAKEYVITEADFQCLTDWPKPEGHKTRIFNRGKRRLKKAIKVLRKGKPGKRYPVGTILELVPPLPALNFLGEAMVKREKGFNPEGNDWEFFVLGVNADSSTRIEKRGKGEVANIGLPCQTCHSAANAFDLVCESGRGCIPLNLTPDLIEKVQSLDPRCSP